MPTIGTSLSMVRDVRLLAARSPEQLPVKRRLAAILAADAVGSFA